MTIRVRDLDTSSPAITVSPEATLEEAAAQMLQGKLGSLVVVDASDRSRPVGIVSSPCVTIDEDDTPMQAAQRMIRKEIRHLPVLRDGSLVGIVTGLDFLRLLAGEPLASGASDGACG